MKTATYDVVIDSISQINGEYPGSVDVSLHRELNGVRDGFETRRIALSDEVVNADGSINQERVTAEVELSILGTI